MNKVIRFAFEWLIAILIAIVVFLLITIFFSPGKVSGQSMMPTYFDGERVFVWKEGYELERGDVITFWSDRITPVKGVSTFSKMYLRQPDLEEKELHIKRVLGIPGDKVVIKKVPNYDKNVVITKVFINGEEKVSSTMIPDIEEDSYTLKNDEYFVVGDNYNNSLDSRLHGPIKKEDIFGKIINGKERTKNLETK